MPDETIDLATVWTRSLDGLPDGSLAPQHRAWIGLTRPIVLVEDTAVLAAPNDFAKEVLETRLRALISDALSRELGREIRLVVTVEASSTAVPDDGRTGQNLHAHVPHGANLPRESDGEDQESVRPVQNVSGERRSEQEPERVGKPAWHQARPSEIRDPEHDGGSAVQPAGTRERDDGGTGTSARTAREPADDDPDLEELESAGVDSDSGLRPVSVSSVESNSAEPARLNPKYSFETFVIGSSNRFAHAAAVAVAEAPARAYNPLFVYGDSGLGKTHLLHAIGAYAQNLYDGARVRYVSSEEFTNDFINSIRDDQASIFQRRYRDIDILLVDDIQFLENKERTQEEFFHTFNTLHNANKQIVISSDRPPKQLSTLEDRLRNRFEWGLITDVQPPDLETRIAILRKKAATERLASPPEVLEFIASKISTNIRELEGALIRVTAFASLNRQPVDLALAELVLKDLIPDGEGPEITAATIMAQTAAYYGLSMEDLCGSSRSRILVTARQVAMYLCRELTALSLPKIGQQFGGRDHTTVMHADKKIRSLMAERRSIYNQVTELTNRIKSQARQQ